MLTVLLASMRVRGSARKENNILYKRYEGCSNLHYFYNEGALMAEALAALDASNNYDLTFRLKSDVVVVAKISGYGTDVATTVALENLNSNVTYNLDPNAIFNTYNYLDNDCSNNNVGGLRTTKYGGVILETGDKTLFDNHEDDPKTLVKVEDNKNHDNSSSRVTYHNYFYHANTKEPLKWDWWNIGGETAAKRGPAPGLNLSNYSIAPAVQLPGSMLPITTQAGGRASYLMGTAQRAAVAQTVTDALDAAPKNIATLRYVFNMNNYVGNIMVGRFAQDGVGSIPLYFQNIQNIISVAIRDIYDSNVRGRMYHLIQNGAVIGYLFVEGRDVIQQATELLANIYYR